MIDALYILHPIPITSDSNKRHRNVYLELHKYLVTPKLWVRSIYCARVRKPPTRYESRVLRLDRWDVKNQVFGSANDDPVDFGSDTNERSTVSGQA